jgi:uncharacterized membrane protein
MEKSKIGLLILITSIAAFLLTFLYIITSFTIKFIVISAILGIGMGISYGLENPSFNPITHLFTLLLFNIIAVVLIYAILQELPLKKRFENKILNRVMRHLHGSQKGMEITVNKISRKFQSRFGNIGFYMAFGLITFAYGTYVTAAIAFLIRVKLKQAMVSITIGSILAIVFWWYLAIGMIPFITPTLIFVVVTSLSILLIGYGLIKEKQIVNKVIAEVLKLKKTPKAEVKPAQKDQKAS